MHDRTMIRYAVFSIFVIAVFLATSTASFSTTKNHHEILRRPSLSPIASARRNHFEHTEGCAESNASKDGWFHAITTFRPAIVTVVALAIFTFPIICSDEATAFDDKTLAIETWQLGNGRVSVANPTRIGDLILTDPELLGSGGGGAVFAMTQKGTANSPEEQQPLPRIALKISWTGSASSVANECQILQTMQQYNVPHVEQCLAMETYPFGMDKQERRVVVALSPVLEKSKGTTASSIADLPTRAQRQSAVQSILESMVCMLAAGVVTTDVQLLIANDNEKDVATVLFIDMTEAKNILGTSFFSSSINQQQSQGANPTSLSLVDSALANSFISEVLTLVPVEETALIRPIVTKTMQQVVAESGRRIHPTLETILVDQIP